MGKIHSRQLGAELREEYARNGKLPLYAPRFEEDMGLVVKVYDGDTITVLAKLNNGLFRFPVRLIGIDTPEIRTKCEEEKKAACKVRDYLSNLCYEKLCCVLVQGKDKYGRILGDVFLFDDAGNRSLISLTSTLLGQKYGLVYGGKTKQTFTSEFLEAITEK